MPSRATPVVLACAILFALSTTAAIIYQNNFDGSALADLNGSTPEVTVGVNSWSAHPNWKQDGSVVNTGYNNAFLPFSPSPGNVYTLTASMTTPVSAPNVRWFAFGFAENANLATDFWQNNAAPWVLYRSNTNVDSFLGPAILLPEDEGNHPGPLTLSIELDTQAPLWSAEWFVNGSSVRTASFASNPSINFIGFGRQLEAIGSFTSFSLTDATTPIPEPGTVACLAILFLCLATYHRKRRI